MPPAKSPRHPPDRCSDSRHSHEPNETQCVQEDAAHKRTPTARLGNPPFTLSSHRPRAMPSPEHNQYFNRQSAKVNAGLPCSLHEQDLPVDHNENYTVNEADHTTPPNPNIAAWSSNAPAVNVDFNALTIPQILTPSSTRSIIPISHPHTLIPTLLNPPPHAFLHTHLPIQWAIGLVGFQHFVFRDRDERYILRENSELRIRGREWGVPVVLLEWLSGEGEEGEGGGLSWGWFVEAGTEGEGGREDDGE